MPAGTHTWVRNPDTGGVWECPNTVLDVYLKRGWEHTNAPDEEPEQVVEPYDPGDHTVAEVAEHIAAIQEASPDEVQRILALEASGKNRTSIVGKPDDNEKE